MVRTLDFDEQLALKKDLMKELAELESLLEKRLKTVELMRMSHHPKSTHEEPCMSDEPSMHETPRSTFPEDKKQLPAVLPSKPLQSYDLSCFKKNMQAQHTRNQHYLAHFHDRFLQPGPDEMETLPMYEETLPPETLTMEKTSEVGPEHAPIEEKEAPKPPEEPRSPMEEAEVTLSCLN